MNAASLVAQLAAAGTPPDLLAAVAKELFAGESAIETIEARKKKDRERHPRKSTEIHGTPQASEELCEQVSFDKETAPTPPKKLNPSRVCETRARGWHRLPEGWAPRKLPDAVQAKVDQWPPGALDDELAAMRRWAANAEDKNGKGRKLDWDQAWRNWIGRRHDERYSRNSANSNLPGVGKTTAAIAGLGGFDDHSPM